MDKVYLTVPQTPKYKNIPFEDMIFGSSDISKYIMWNQSGTITRLVEVTEELRNKRNIDDMINDLTSFVNWTKPLLESDLHKHYDTFHVPKKSGGLRKICAPDKELSAALKVLSSLFEKWMPATHHTSAFAYINGRSTIDEREKHRRNDSVWYGYFDFHDFFGSTTPDFVFNMLSMIYPFNFIMEYEEGNENLRKALSLAFLDGGLPQGTPFSPMITNVVMIPFDHIMTNRLHSFFNPRAKDKTDRFIYTRYADDIAISCRNEFSISYIQDFILDTLKQLGAGFSLNTKKTKYQSRNGKNFHLGVIINKDNEITLGHEKKRRIKAMIASYVMDKKNGVEWDLHDVQIVAGRIAYFKKVEPKSCETVLNRIGEKFGVDVNELIHDDLASKGAEDDKE